MRRAFALVTLTLLICLAGWVATAQAPVPPAPTVNPYTPTEVESLKLQLAQKDAQIAQNAFQMAYQNLTSLGEQIKKDHNWPNEVIFNVQTMTFMKMTPPSAPAPVAPATPPAPSK